MNPLFIVMGIIIAYIIGNIVYHMGRIVGFRAGEKSAYDKVLAVERKRMSSMN